MKPASSTPRRLCVSLLSLLFAAVMASGLWPAIALLNSERLVLGVPMLAAWACLIPLLCTGLMLLANRLVAPADVGPDVPAPPERAATRERRA